MNRIQRRFDELEEMCKQVAESLGIKVVHKPNKVWTMGQPRGTSSHEVETIDRSLFKQWRVSVLTLLEQVFGPSKSAYREFADYSSSYQSSAQYFHGLLPIFRAAKSDYEGGYLFSVRNLVHAEVFSDELEQAKHFLDANHKMPAAVIAGVVLETSLRTLCEEYENVESAENINKMNNDLAKAGAYNKMRQKQVTAWANIRNDAAHGHPEEFDNGDVSRMIDGIRDFVASQLS